MTNAPEDRVVELPSAGLPADHGVSSLALLMQLAGTIFALGAALVALLLLFNSDTSMKVVAIAALSTVRSLVHRRAGTALLYARAGGHWRDGYRGAPVAALHAYIAFALGHSILLAILLASEFELSGARAVAYGAGLALWPLVLAAIVASRKLAAFSQDVPSSEDKGFEGASILMAVFGACGALAVGVLFFLTAPSLWSSWSPGDAAVVAVFAVFAIRSIIHLGAGLAGLRETSVDRAVERTKQYTRFALTTTVCIGGVLFVLALPSARLIAIVGVGAVCAALAAWPLIVRRFFGDRQFAELLAGDRAALHRRAPDAGLTGLGWLLVGHAVLTASALIPMLVSGPAPLGGPFAPIHAIGGRSTWWFDLSYVFGGVHSPWWTAGATVLEAWAGYELVRMSLHHRRVALCYGAVASAVALYLAWSLVDTAGQRLLVYPALAVTALLQLVLPIATLLLVRRPIAPAARASYRRRA